MQWLPIRFIHSLRTVGPGDDNVFAIGHLPRGLGRLLTFDHHDRKVRAPG